MTDAAVDVIRGSGATVACAFSEAQNWFNLGELSLPHEVAIARETNIADVQYAAAFFVAACITVVPRDSSLSACSYVYFTPI